MRRDFADVRVTAASHFRLYILAAVLHVVERLAHNLGSLDDVGEQFPFVGEYLADVEQLGEIDAASAGATMRWLERVREWEAEVHSHLPLRALRDALALDDEALTLLLGIGLVEEDSRFGFVIDAAQPGVGQHRPTLSLLTSWWRDAEGVTRVREVLATLMDYGLVQVLNGDAPRTQWTFQTPPIVWDALRGETLVSALSGITFLPLSSLPSLDDIVLSGEVRRVANAAPLLVAKGDVHAIVVRGPHSNGRGTIVRAIARAAGRGVLEVRGPVRADEERWLQLGALATLLRAMPVVRVDHSPGEGSEIPRLRGYDGPIAVVAGKHGALYGDGIDGALTVTVPTPGPVERRVLWQRALGDGDDTTASLLAERFRLTSGSLRRAAAAARTGARVDGRSLVTAADVRKACRPLHREIERLASYVPASGGWHSIAACADTLEELRSLELRCRYREGLYGHVGPLLERQVTTGVRALFAGPSGTGKTMAARLLASTLEMDLYRLDLASVVNKYIGETEKNLDQLFSRAEELDVILLIDEGDALLTGRTAVQTSNDRYANLETNFLLQRLEHYEGILIVTTNAASRIDSAFQRRMDVVVEFRMPSPHERWLVWQLHLPPDHAVDHAWLQEASVRCALSGGQIRNAVLHASLVALEEHRRLRTADLELALEREYRKTGTVCPLPRTALAV
jgi:hypothetical protein